MENLDWLEWSPVTTPLTFNVTQHGVFLKNITTIELSRDADLKLVAIGKGRGSIFNTDVAQWVDNEANSRAGKFVSHTEETIGKTECGAIVKLRGVFVFDKNFNFKTGPIIFHAKVSEASILYKNNEIPDKHVEWIVNFPIEPYIFSRLTKRYPSGFYEREKSDGTFPENHPNENPRRSLYHFRCEFTLNNQKISFIVGKIIGGLALKDYNPGFLEFENINNNQLPDEETRKNILAALSFALGRQLTSVGSTTLSQNNQRIELMASKLNLFDNNACIQASLPPTLLTTDDLEIDESKISRIISAVVTHMDFINIRSSLSFVWTGLASPLDVQAAHIGAAIECLRDSYFNFHKKKLSDCLIDKKIWKNKIKDKLLESFDSIINNLYLENIEITGIDKLRENLEKLNYKPLSMKDKNQVLFDLLSLPVGEDKKADFQVGEVEKAALKERNKPAHGHFYQESDYQKLSMTIDALYSLFNRLVIKMTDASDYYIDYSTYGYPVRHINEALGGPEGDGKPAFSKKEKR